MDVQLRDGSRVVFDAGTGIRPLGLTFPPAAPSVAGARPGVTVLLTHCHGDHVNGLAHFAPLVTRSHQVRVACGGVDAATMRVIVNQQLTAPLFPTLDGLTEAVAVEAFDENGGFAVTPTCRVVALPAQHPGNAMILRVDDATGPIVAYAPDNELALWNDEASVAAWRRRLVNALTRIPVLVHDATYVDDELSSYRGWGHSSAEEATRFAMQCAAGTLLLTHHHPERSDDQVDEIVARCRALVKAADSSLRVLGATERSAVVVD